MSTLYSYPDSFRTNRILIAAEISKSDVKLAENFVYGESNKQGDFMKKFPLGKVPAMTTKDGANLFETNAIVEYVSSENLRGKSPAVRAQVRQWEDFADQSLVQSVMTLFLQTKNLLTPSKDVVDRQKKEFEKNLQFLNQSLGGKKFLVGDALTSADIAVFSLLLDAFQVFAGKDIRGKFGNVMKWFVGVQADAAVKKVIGSVKLLDVSPGVAPPAKKEKKKAQPQPKKAEKKPAAKEEEEPKPAPSKDPLGACPAGNFDLDDFKRYYSNNEEAKSIEYFWQKFDKENYSIWYCEYKYPEDLAMVFMSCNLIGGFLQRLDKLHKYAFASMGLFGKDNDSTISGIWVWRGHELVFPLSPNWQVDYGSYEWKKLDVNDPAVKKQVNEYLAWEGEFGGKTFNQGKIFK